MNLTIKPLTPELASDYFDFFENRAFTDDSPYRCYCQVYQMTKEQQKAASDEAKANGYGGGEISRKVAERQIESGALKGYLAFVDDLAIGWCNANDKTNLPTESASGFRVEATTGKKEKVVLCFEIAPEYRGKGIATALLNRVVADAIEEGYATVEGFPRLLSERDNWDFTGPVRLYEKAGFTSIKRQDGSIFMRRELNE